MNNKQAGFTLIELVVVIVILGILAATALPKFVDLSGEAKTAAVQGVAGGVSSAAAVNYAAYAASNGTKGFNVTDSTTNQCSFTQINNYMQTPIDSAKYTIAATGGGAGTCSAGAGATVSCTISDATDATKTAAATLICTK